jgi:hypothetical protein
VDLFGYHLIMMRTKKSFATAQIIIERLDSGY